MNFTFRDIVWVGIIALILVVLSKCHRDKTNAIKDDVAALVAGSKAKDSVHAIETQILVSKLALALGREQNAHADKLTAEHKLEKSIATGTRLSAALRRIWATPTDTSAIYMPQEYVDYCDSLAWTADSIHADYTKFKRNNAWLLLAKDSTYKLQKQLYDQERAARADCKRDYEALQSFYKQLDHRTKPTNQVYIGAELLGSERLLIQNIGVALSLKTKTNKLWQVSGGLQNGGGWYGRINGNILIRLRKQ